MSWMYLARSRIACSCSELGALSICCRTARFDLVILQTGSRLRSHGERARNSTSAGAMGLSDRRVNATTIMLNGDGV